MSQEAGPPQTPAITRILDFPELREIKYDGVSLQPIKQMKIKVGEEEELLERHFSAGR